MQMRSIAKRFWSRSTTGSNGDIGGIAGPHLRTDRTAVAVEQLGNEHLAKIGPVVLRVAVPAEAIAAGAGEDEAGGVGTMTPTANMSCRGMTMSW